jgi:hypothetical protein
MSDPDVESTPIDPDGGSVPGKEVEVIAANAGATTPMAEFYLLCLEFRNESSPIGSLFGQIA